MGSKFLVLIEIGFELMIELNEFGLDWGKGVLAFLQELEVYFGVVGVGIKRGMFWEVVLVFLDESIESLGFELHLFERVHV